MLTILKYKCGHTELARFEYPQAAADWKRWAKTQLCAKC